MIGVKLMGAKALARAFGKLQKGADDAMGAALYAEGFAIMAKSTKRVPVKQGFLKLSAYTHPPKKTSGELGVGLGYAKDYALPVHDRHPTKAFYLKIPMDEARRGYAKRIAARVRDAILKGRRPGKPIGNFPESPKE